MMNRPDNGTGRYAAGAPPTYNELEAKVRELEAKLANVFGDSECSDCKHQLSCGDNRTVVCTGYEKEDGR